MTIIRKTLYLFERYTAAETKIVKGIGVNLKERNGYKNTLVLSDSEFLFNNDRETSYFKLI